MKDNRSNIKGIPILLTAAFVWGVAFTAQSAGSEYLSAFSYTAIRYALGIIPLIPISIFLEIRKCEKTRMRRTATSGAVCGTIMFAAIVLQQYGIQLTGNSGKAGFITCLYILIVPIFGLFLKRFPAVNVWCGVLFGVIGMYLLTVKESSGIELGDILVMLSAVFWAIHIITIDRFASDIYAISFSVTQFAVVSILSTVCMLIFDTVTFGAVKGAWLPLAYGGFVSVAIGYTLQTVGQKYASPVPASLALSMESVFATIAGAVILGERLEIRGYIGCIMIFAGIILAQLPDKYFKIGVIWERLRGK